MNHLTSYHGVISEIYQIELSPFDQKAKVLAITKKINEATEEILKNSSSFNESHSCDEPTLYQLACVLKTIRPICIKIWKRLSRPAQSFFDKLVQFSLPPQKNSGNNLSYCSTSSPLPDIFTGHFRDNRLFFLELKQITDSQLVFKLPNTPGYTLNRILSKSLSNDKKIIYHHIIQQTTKKINDIFYFDLSKDMPALNYLPKQGSFRQNFESLQFFQLLAQRKWYYQKLIGALSKSSVLLPAQMGGYGEYFIIPDGEKKSLRSINKENTHSTIIEEMGAKIRHYFTLERTYGIYFIGKKDLLKENIDQLFFVFNERVYAKINWKKIKFINEPIQERHKRLREIICQTVDPYVYEVIFNPTFEAEFEKEALTEADFFLNLAIKNSIFPETLIEFAVNKPIIDEESKLALICEVAKQLVADIPRKTRPFTPCDPKFPEKSPVEQTVNCFLERSSQLDRLIVLHLFSYCALYSKRSVTEVLNDLFNWDNSTEKENTLRQKMTNYLDQEAEKNWLLKVSESDGCSTCGEYFELIFWNRFFEELPLINETKPLPLSRQISFLRAAWILTQGDDNKESEIQEHLINLLHQRLLYTEKKTQTRACRQLHPIELERHSS